VLLPLIEEAYASWTAASAVNNGDIGLGLLQKLLDRVYTG